MPDPAYLPDVNLLVAHCDPSHIHHHVVERWWKQIGPARFLLCPVTESGFVRLMVSPSVGGLPMEYVLDLLREITVFPGCESLPISCSWLELIEPLEKRLQGYRQITDAWLLGLAIRNSATLVTLDKRIRSLAGTEYAGNLLVLG